MGEMQMLFPIEPNEYWQKLRAIVEQVVIQHNQAWVTNISAQNAAHRSLLKAAEVCAIFKISKPTLYDWMAQGRLPSIKIESRRFFRWEDVDTLITQNVEQSAGQKKI